MVKSTKQQQERKTLQDLRGKSVIVNFITGYEKINVKAGRLEEIAEFFVVVDKTKIFLGQGKYPSEAVLDVAYLMGGETKKAYENPYYQKLLNTQGTLARKKGALTLKSLTYSCRQEIK